MTRTLIILVILIGCRHRQERKLLREGPQIQDPSNQIEFACDEDQRLSTVYEFEGCDLSSRRTIFWEGMTSEEGTAELLFTDTVYRHIDIEGGSTNCGDDNPSCKFINPEVYLCKDEGEATFIYETTMEGEDAQLVFRGQASQDWWKINNVTFQLNPEPDEVGDEEACSTLEQIDLVLTSTDDPICSPGS